MEEVLPRIYLDRYNVGFFQRRFKKLARFPGKLLVHPVIWEDDFRRGDAGLEKTEKFLSFLLNRGTDVVFPPLPPCLLAGRELPVTRETMGKSSVKDVFGIADEQSGTASEALRKPRFISQNDAVIMFLWDYAQEEPREMDTHAKCPDCKFFGKACKGVAEFKNSRARHTIADLCCGEVSSFLKHAKKPAVLDIGPWFFGPKYMPFMKETDCTIHCIDPSFSVVESLKGWTKERALENRIFPVAGIAERMPFKDQSFDCVLSLASYSHIQNIEMALGETWRVLRPEGIAYFRENAAEQATTPSSDIVSEKTDSLMLKEHILVRHYRRHTIDEAKRLFESQKFRISSVSSLPHKRHDKFGWHAVLKRA